jgi:tRNA threonylcarbamoyladenosine biosynthesis protein TsaE
MNTPAVHISTSVEETESIAANLSKQFVGGEVVALHGDLGAGKTQFVRGLLRGLNGNTRSVSSPTFVLLNVYDTGRLELYHLDAYRMTTRDDFEAIGFNELLDQHAVVAVEWPERIAGLLPPQTWHVKIDTTGEMHRRIEITPPQQ